MPDFLALDWEQHHLHGLDAQVTTGRVQVRHAFRLAWPDETTPAQNPDEAGRWLARELDRLGIRSRRTLVSLPREEVIVRRLDVPDVPDNELPEIVRLQAETKSSASLDRLVLDFLPLPRLSAEGRHVLMVTLPRDRLDRLRRTAAAAELDLVSVGISPAAAAELVARVERDRGEDPEGTSLVVARADRRLEITLMRNRRVLFTHSTHVVGQNDEQDSRAALAEIRRSHGSLMRLDPNLAPARAWVIGDEPSRGPSRDEPPPEAELGVRELASEQAPSVLTRTLQDNLPCEVRHLDPLRDSGATLKTEEIPGTPGAYVYPVGLLLAQSGGTVEAVDFLAPRRPVVRPDRRRLKRGLAAAGILLSVTAAYGGVQWKAGQLDREIDTLQERLERVQDGLERGQPTLQKADTVREWARQNVDILQQMRTLQEALSSTERLYLADLEYPLPGGRTHGLAATAYARSRADAEQLKHELSARGYVVHPTSVNRDSADEEYPYRFELVMEIEVPSEEPRSPR